MTTNASGSPLMVLEQILVDNEYRYRDRSTGRVYTAVEARDIKVPHRVDYIGGRR